MRHPRWRRIGRSSLVLAVLGWTLLLPALHAGVAEAGPQFTPSERREVQELARRTWAYLVWAQDPRSGFPADHVEHTASGTWRKADYTTATNVGLMLMAVPAARGLGLLNAADERRWLAKMLDTLESMPASRGLAYNYFQTRDGAPDPKRFVSSVDNAWLAAGLWVVARSAGPELGARALALYRAMEFSVFYSPELGQFSPGYSDADGTTSAAHYGLLCTETRIISVIAIGKGEVPPGQWFRLYRTLPAEWTWQRQVPQGRTVQRPDGQAYFQGWYLVDGVEVVPSWGGSLFEFLMPLLVVPELELAQDGLGENDRRVVRLQKEFCLRTAAYPVWGLSPCSDAEPGVYRYVEAGDARLGSQGYPDPGLVTPYASVLALEIDPKGVVRNLRTLKHRFRIWTPYGFYDAVNVRTGAVAERFLTLDQAMIFLALDNALQDGATRKRFFAGEIRERIAPLLREEKFY